MTRRVGILLAAGASRRMRGGDKLMNSVRGRPLLTVAADQMAQSHVDEVLVAVAPDRTEHVNALSGLNVTCVEIPNAVNGMGVSLSSAVKVAGPARAYVIGLADMPDVQASDYNAVMEAVLGAASMPIAVAVGRERKRGHPVAFDGAFHAELLELSGDTGAKRILQAHADQVCEVPLGSAVNIDLDTPEAWAKWKAFKG